jgi:hypothetical protein
VQLSQQIIPRLHMRPSWGNHYSFREFVVHSRAARCGVYVGASPCLPPPSAASLALAGTRSGSRPRMSSRRRRHAARAPPAYVPRLP